MNCPNCGFPVLPENESRIFGFESKIIPSGKPHLPSLGRFVPKRKLRQPDWERTDFSDFNFGDGLAIPVGTQYTRDRPARNATMQSDVGVPAMQSLITGLLVGLSVGIVCVVFDLSDNVGIPFSCAFVAGCLTWLILSFQYHRLLWDKETITNNGVADEKEGTEPATTRIEVDITNDKQKQRVILDLGIPQDKLVTFAKGILAGKSTSVNTWTGSKGLFSDTEFDNLRDELIARRLAHWKNPEHHNLGWKFNKVGFRVLCQIVE